MAINKEIIHVTTKGVNKTTNALKGIGSTALKMGAAFYAAKGIVTGMRTIVQDGAKLQGVERAFHAMGAEIGFSETSLQKLQNATDGTVSKLDLMTQANQAMMLGVVKSDEEMARLFDTAQRLGQAIGVDTAHALESLTTGMGRQSKLMLDNLGIIVKTEDAYLNYAKANDKTVESLTDVEKKMAFNQEVIRISEDMVNSLGEEQLTTADKMRRLGTTFADIGTSIGQSTSGLVDSALDAFQGLADSLASAVDFAGRIDWQGTWSNISNNTQVLFDAWGELFKLGMDFIPDAIRPALAKAFDIAISFFGKVLDAVVYIGKDLWKPISGNFSVLVHDLRGMWEVFTQNTSDTFELIGVKIQNGFTKMVNSVKKDLNSVIEKTNQVLGTSFETFDMGNIVDTEGLADQMENDMLETRSRLAEQRQGIVDDIESSEIMDFIKGMFVPDEDDIDTFADFGEKYLEIWQGVSDAFIEIDENKNTKINENDEQFLKNQKKTGDKSTKISRSTGLETAEAWSKVGASFASLNEAIGGNAVITARLEQATAIVNTYAGATRALKDHSAPASYAIAASVIATGLANVVQIEKQLGEIRSSKSSKAQYGADFITSGPETLLVGDNVGGRERVTVTPIGTPENAPIMGGENLTLNISGNVLSDDFTEETLIPKIREGLRLGGKI